MGLDFSLEGFASFAAGSDDKDGIVTGDRACNFRKFCAVQCGGKGLRSARRRLQNEKIFSGANIEKEFAESAGKRRHGGNFLKRSCGRAIAFSGFDQFEFLKVAGKRGLCDAHALVGKPTAQIFLIRDTLGGNQSENLPVPKCLGRAHPFPIYNPLYIYTFPRQWLSNIFDPRFKNQNTAESVENRANIRFGKREGISTYGKSPPRFEGLEQRFRHVHAVCPQGQGTGRCMIGSKKQMTAGFSAPGMLPIKNRRKPPNDRIVPHLRLQT